MTACGSGGDSAPAASSSSGTSTSPGTPSAIGPTITDLTLDKRGHYQSNTSVGDLSGSLNISSTGGSNITRLVATMVNSSGQALGQLSTPVQAGAGNTLVFKVTLYLTQIPLGTYTIQVTVQNAAGATSNVLTGSYAHLTNPWVEIATPPPTPTPVDRRLPRYFSAVAEAGGKVFVISGESAIGLGSMARHVDAFDIATSTWSPMPNAPRSRAGARAVTIDGKIYVLGGIGENFGEPEPAVDVYDPAAGTWNSVAPMPTPRALAAVVVFNRKIYVMGGTQSRNPTNPQTLAAPMTTVEIFDVDAGTWSTGTPLPQALLGAAAAAAPAGIYLSGGYSTGGFTPTLLPNFSFFDPVSNGWLADAGRTVSRGNHALIALGRKLYAVGGATQEAAGRAADRATTAESADMPASIQAALAPRSIAPLYEAGYPADGVAVNGKLYVFAGGRMRVYTPEQDVL